MIDLSYNSLTGFHQHPRFLQWKRLQGFYIGHNQVQGQLPVPSQTTTVYSASSNNFTGEIPSLICEVKSLRMLELSFNSMIGALPSCLGGLSNSLSVLNLRRNNFHGMMMNACMHGIMLKSIDLSENEFTGQLSRSLKNCSNLEVLSIGDNSFDDVFPSWLGTLAMHQVLILRSNKFYGPIQSSATVYSQFPNLRVIDLSINSFSGELHQNYFQTWNAMKSVFHGKLLLFKLTLMNKGVKREYEYILNILTVIDLSCNHFEGEIPLSLQDLHGLYSLNLSNNHFTGRVLPSLGYLKNLESLDLSRNKLTGEIPQQLVQLNFLSIFNVSFNHLDGRIPEGQQFNTFNNDSYEGNPQLCGKPLSKECQGSKASRHPRTKDTSNSLLPSKRIDWIIICFGVGSRLIIGIVIGNSLHTTYSDRFKKRNDMDKDTL